MTLFIPDVSHHQQGIDIQALKNEGAGALIARVGQGAGRRSSGAQYGTTRDREWTRHRDEARRVGLPLVAYWYVGNLISAADNATLAASWVGDTSIPWMIDHEDASGSLAFYCRVVEAFKARGLRVILGYIPRWYWEGAGRADLTCGPPLVNSRYSLAAGTPAEIYAKAGGDAGNGWPDFGGRDVLLWQFTNQGRMAGRAIDVSAFRGSRADLELLINGTPSNRKEDAMLMTARQPSTGAIVVGDGVTRRHLPTPTAVANMKFVLGKAGLQLVDLGDVEDISTLGSDIGTAIGALADDEADIIEAVRQIVTDDANADVDITPEQVQQLAAAVVAAVPAPVAEAVRQAFARAGATQAPATSTVPDLIGRPPSEASQKLATAGWTGPLSQTLGVTNDVGTLGKIVDQEPGPGAVADTTTEITITVATQLAVSPQ